MYLSFTVFNKMRVYYVTFTRLNCFNVTALIQGGRWVGGSGVGWGVWGVVVAGEKRVIFVQGPKNRGWGDKEFSSLDCVRVEQLFQGPKTFQTTSRAPRKPIFDMNKSSNIKYINTNIGHVYYCFAEFFCHFFNAFCQFWPFYNSIQTKNGQMDPGP